MKKFVKIFTLVVALFAILAVASCAPKDGAAAKEKLSKKGYQDIVLDSTVEPAAIKLLTKKNVDVCLTASKTEKNKDGEDVTYTLHAVLFTSKADAKASIKAMEDRAKENGEKTEVKQSGKWLYYGSEKAMKDFA